ncbi:MAG: long-chain-acyl-CoA synthetase [Xanthobacteraceae bacterium]
MTLSETDRPAQRTAVPDSALRDWVRALEATAPISANPQRLLTDAIEEQTQLRDDAPALLSVDECLTYGALTGRANAYARWALCEGIAKGEIVALMMPNRPEYLAIWLGLTSVGVVVALINTQLRGSFLAHCIDIAAAKHAIVAADFCDEFLVATTRLARRPKIWSHGEGAGIEESARLDHAVQGLSGQCLTSPERRAVSIKDRALLIYTSGTTGLPKAAYVSHRRLLQWSLWFAGLMNTGPDDRMYDCLPLYHSIGGVVAIGSVLVHGGSVLIRDKFSAQHFWSDIVDGDCTLFQYIGELCRYLLAAPDNPRQRAHRLRLCCGNGLRAETWEKFQKKFAIPRILEFYAATEGNFSLYNVEGKVGAIGRVPSYLSHRFPLALVKFDTVSGKPARDENGFCIRCATSEVGEAVGLIRNNSSHASGEFEGYTNTVESEQKILRNVFADGDTWYRTGDLMRMDAGGFYYFIDRIGDTFRWKGENVSTSEVAAAIETFQGIKDVDVYGVSVPGTEGAVGMAAIVADNVLDLQEFHRHLARTLPHYARPLFVRVTDRITATSTFKHKKSDLKREGYDPSASGDPIYFDDPQQRAFVPLDRALFARIQSSGVRL